jgi:hypothetical protein
MKLRLISVFFLFLATIFMSACNPLDVKTKAGLQVITADIPSSLFLDGQYLDKTPYIAKDIKPGVYTLRIQPDDVNLTPYETSINLRKGLLTVVTWKPGRRPELSGGVIYEMEKLKSRKSTELSIVTVPDGAIVTIQGREKEFAPVTLTDIEPGQKEFEVSLPSYDTQKHTVNLVAGHRTTITVKLAKSEVIEVNATGQTATTSAKVALPSPIAKPSATPSTRGATASAQSASSSAQKSTITGPRVKINTTNYFQNGKEVLRVRDASSNAGKELGFADVGSEYAYLNKTENGFHNITFNGISGWVSAQFSTVIK